MLEGNAPSLCSYIELLSSNHNAVVVKNDSSEDFAPAFVVVFFFSVEGKRHREDNLFFLRPLPHTLLISCYCSACIDQSPRGSSNKEAICSQTWLCHRHSTLDSKRVKFR